MASRESAKKFLDEEAVEVPEGEEEEEESSEDGFIEPDSPPAKRNKTFENTVKEIEQKAIAEKEAKKSVEPVSSQKSKKEVDKEQRERERQRKKEEKEREKRNKELQKLAKQRERELEKQRKEQEKQRLSELKNHAKKLLEDEKIEIAKKKVEEVIQNRKRKHTTETKRAVKKEDAAIASEGVLAVPQKARQLVQDATGQPWNLSSVTATAANMGSFIGSVFMVYFFRIT
jgi:hypothetical protein